MKTPGIVCCAAAVMATAIGGPAVADQPLVSRPGRVVVLRDKGIDEPARVAPRFAVPDARKLATATFEVTYNGFGSEAREAFETAVGIISAVIVSPVPIRVEANWTPLEEDVLGSARANFVRAGVGLPDPLTWYPDALADALLGTDAGDGDFDIIADFNSDFSDWYFGTDGNPPFGNTDMVTVVLHELCHGLGFSGSAEVDEMGEGGWGYDGGIGLLPVIYDRFTEDGAGVAIIDDDVYPNPSTELADVLEGNSLYWNGIQAVSVNGGTRPRLYAPASWDAGSSYSHLDEVSYPAGDDDSLMTPELGRAEAIHDPGPIALCMFQDMGWATGQVCASDLSSYWVAVAARSRGVGDSLWRTSLGVFNQSGFPATVLLEYRREDQATASRVLSIPAANQRVIDDVVGFVGSTGSGSLEVSSEQPLLVGSRTFNVSDDGTYGQYVDGVPSSEGLSAGQSGRLILLRENASFRSNIGFTNSGPTDAEVTVQLFDGSGLELDSFDVPVPSGLNVQENRPFLNRAGRTDIDEGSARITVTAGSGILVYGSVADNATDDATTIPLKR